MHSANLLIEFLTEELPPHNLENFGNQFALNLNEQLNKFKTSQSKSTFFITPRRFGCIISHINNQENDVNIRKKGPGVNSALVNNEPTKALLGFATSCQVKWNELEQNPDGYFYFSYIKKGNLLHDVLPSAILESLKQLPIAKMMRWGDNDYQFVRPLHNLLLIYNNQVICQDITIMGLKPNNYTFGHRILSTKNLEIDNSDNYEQILQQKGFVIASFEQRKNIIMNGLTEQAQILNLKLNDIPGLLDEVTALTEYPNILVGQFDEKFLEVPQECLILSMAKNQKYFALLDKNNKLTNKFLFVTNTISKDPRVIINGNQKVLTARLTDAKFFFDIDKKYPLNEYTKKLKNVIYHNKLGTQLQRVERIQTIASKIAQIWDFPENIASDTAYLLKGDLTTEMVGEFPELQGVIGKYYALIHNQTDEVAQAIEQHYYPRFSGDDLPNGKLATIMALSDKLETLIGIWGIGLIPSGDKDQFALRRAALGIIRILLNQNINIKQLLEISYSTFEKDILNKNVINEVYDFIMVRLNNYLQERLNTTATINAVLSTHPNKFNHIVDLIHILNKFAEKPSNQNLLQANKRIENILKKNQANTKDNLNPDKLDINKLVSSELNLYNTINKYKDTLHDYITQHKWDDYFECLSIFSEPIDQFFDNVMVMDDNPEIRMQRINLLNITYINLNQVCVLSKLV